MSSGIIRNDRKATITISFAKPADALTWLLEAIERHAIQDDAVLYQMDGLDDIVGEQGVPAANRFIVRRDGDRPYPKVGIDVTATVVKGS